MSELYELCDCCEVCEDAPATTTRGPFSVCESCAEGYDTDGMADDIPAPAPAKRDCESCAMFIAVGEREGVPLCPGCIEAYDTAGEAVGLPVEWVRYNMNRIRARLSIA